VIRARLITLPSTDGNFYRYAVQSYHLGIDTPNQLQAVIRARYPKAVVQRGRALAPGEARWYVYRDEEAARR
jgi:hypothetical protein